MYHVLYIYLIFKLVYNEKPLTNSVVKSPATNSSLMYQRYVTSVGFASARQDNLTSEPSAMRPPANAPPTTDTETFGAYLTCNNKGG